MGRPPKKISVRSSVREYHTAEQQGYVLHNDRQEFMRAVSLWTPEVIRDLYSNVHIHYEMLYGRRYCEPLTLLTNRHPRWASEWFQNKPFDPEELTSSDDEDNWSDGKLPTGQYIQWLRQSLCDWAKRYQILSVWTLDQALDTNLTWASRYTSRAEDAVWDFSKQGQPETWKETECILPRATFEYLDWQGWTPKRYQKHLQAEWEKHLAKKMKLVHEQSKAMIRPKPLLLDRIVYLALRLCRNWIAEEIHEKIRHPEEHNLPRIDGIHELLLSKSIEGIRKDISIASQALGFPIPRGPRTE